MGLFLSETSPVSRSAVPSMPALSTPHPAHLPSPPRSGVDLEFQFPPNLVILRLSTARPRDPRLLFRPACLIAWPESKQGSPSITRRLAPEESPSLLFHPKLPSTGFLLPASCSQPSNVENLSSLTFVTGLLTPFLASPILQLTPGKLAI